MKKILAKLRQIELVRVQNLMKLNRFLGERSILLVVSLLSLGHFASVLSLLLKSRFKLILVKVFLEKFVQV